MKPLEIRARRLLLADWFAHLGRESGLNLQDAGSSLQALNLRVPNEFDVTANFIEKPPFLNFVASDPGQQGTVDAIAQEAVGRVERGELGGEVWYSTELHEIEFNPFPSPIGSLLHRLGSQKRIVGWRRLGGHILLELTENLPDDWSAEKAILAPKAVVHVHIAVPGPTGGHFSRYLAHSIVETVAAICAFALGRSVALPPALFPSKPETLSQLAARQTDRDVLTLARNHISLDILSPLGHPGGLELFTRIRAALLSFDAALRQEHSSVKCILYVVAAESLTTPYAKWRDLKLTKRFIEFFDDLMPTDLDQIVAHGNFEEAFGIRRGKRTARALRRELLGRIYAFRSGQLHEGLQPTYLGFGAVLGMENEIRPALFADFAERAILRYLAAPRVSLVGHPAHPDECSGEIQTEAGRASADQQHDSDGH